MTPIIPNKVGGSTYTPMCFFFPTGTEMGKIPPPNALYVLNKGFLVVYMLKGDFTTIKASKFLSDAISRFLTTYEKAQYKTIVPEREPEVCNSLSYNLKEITKDLKSLKSRFKTSMYADKFEDEAFWTMKIYVENRLRNGEMITQQELEVFLLNEFGRKERSTLRAKAKAVFNWYAKRQFKPSGRIHLMSRKENAKKQSETKAKKMKAEILGAVESMRFLNEKITAKRVSEYLNCSRTTATKYLKELELI